MNYMDLRAEILNGPKAAACAPHVVTNEMGKVADYAIKDQAIADILNEDRKPLIVKLEVGDGAISLALGMPAGPVFLFKLRRLASTALPEGATDEQIEPVAVAQQAVASLAKVGFDIGDPTVRAGLDMFVGSLLTVEQVAAIKALAEVPDIVSAGDVSRALRGPWE